ncbi:MAG: cytochrome c [Xanthobacteraceae bacterium]|nr:cytochrome c [Xanthobacteraceae bacterium]
MPRKIVVLAVVAAVIGLFVFWGLTIPATVPASALPQRQPNLENGRTMFHAGGCASCHATPGQDDKTKLGGGFALKSPFGTFYAPNISPDRNDGIGKWSEPDFVTAMVKGTAPDGSHLYPAFPYASYQRMRTDDIRDLFAYLKTLPVVQGKAKPHELPFPFNIRRTLGVWKFLFLDGKPFAPDASKDAAWNRGAYLVNGPGHCAECHSPRNLLGGIVESQRFAGGPEPTGDGFVPNITQKSLSLSQENLVKLLETGETPDGDTIGGEMAKVTSNTGKLSAADREAIATYVRSLPPVEGPKRPESK